MFRVYLENLNWVSSAQLLSGPTPERFTVPPQFEEFRRGAESLRRLQEANKVAILLEEHDERAGGTVPGGTITPRELAAHHDRHVAERPRASRSRTRASAPGPAAAGAGGAS